MGLICQVKMYGFSIQMRIGEKPRKNDAFTEELTNEEGFRDASQFGHAYDVLALIFLFSRFFISISRPTTNFDAH